MLRNILFACLMVLPAAPLRALDGQAERFVHLALELGLHDTDYVDAYLGPPEWRDAARAANRAPAAVAADIARLLAELGAYEPTQAERARHGALLKNVRAMDARARMALGEARTELDAAEVAALLADDGHHLVDLVAAPQQAGSIRGVVYDKDFEAPLAAAQPPLGKAQRAGAAIEPYFWRSRESRHTR